MSKMGTLYTPGDSIFHRMDGSVKIILFAAWTVTTFLFLDLRVFLVMLFVSSVMLASAQIPFRRIRVLLWFMTVFNIFNAAFILVITPVHGTELTGTNTPVINIGYNWINAETLFYVLTLSAKYLTLLPISIVFIFTTHPSQFASSLNRLGVPYKIAYAVNIAFRYIPDIQSEFRNITNSMQMRGIGFRKGEAPLLQRIKNISSIAVPLLFSSLQRIEVVSNAMELRGFGTNKRRTWYNATKPAVSDYMVAAVCIAAVALAVWLKTSVLTSFWYPF
ncbi:Energy-coupling factor transporter transmembrane protein EcfT [Paenibacillus sp. CECT 9249]|uniref:energy-coupling factor transporter transmembrane component T family protein n=1 Tax=Paenibacillus sp. CECT 9249 TaxID=2845385 RepID=UPI001E2969CA|nr:energy-coupling factor transporter transmembrane component T [Paenibacillus sp. CECT 9249]CAH0121711.1 Energy-coupling factor transporter transmembrane protein EcfT [Paenibacillus sp. CECT 9249]